MSNVKKEVSLVLRGFSIPPDEAEAICGIATTRKGKKGDPVRPWLESKYSRSFISYSKEFTSDEGFDFMLTELLSWLGGADKLRKCCRIIAPEFIQVEFLIPLKSLKYQESRYLESSTIDQVALIGASVGFSFK